MTQTTRQNNLLVAENWTTLYQAFRNADFQSYDFETLRKSMIDYLRIYYPEDFNDFIESSEYIALIDLIAFLGQNLAFRADLNARENFIDTAERRDSVLKLARLISYTPKRNIAAKGFLKITSVRTSETLVDSEGVDIRNTEILFNDASNSNWLEQFILVLNSALIPTTKIGRPSNSAVINDVLNQEYRINTIPTALPVFSFNQQVNSVNNRFEVVSAGIQDQLRVAEQSPRQGRSLGIISRNDNLGLTSPNTGYFLHFTQGELRSLEFTLTESVPNRVVSLNYDNINNSDVWLYKLDQSGNSQELWDAVPALTGVNIDYNTLSQTTRKIFQVTTRANDQIDLVFGDGVFADIPQGTFRVYFRVGNNVTYKIKPEEMQNISVPVNYLGRSGRTETLTVTASLQYTVANATSRESLDEIRLRAPQQFYTQNRMVNAEDYNLFPFSAFSNIVKVKAVNRVSSGVSRFLDVRDVTGKYSSTNVFGADGILYRDDVLSSQEFDFSDVNDILRALRNIVTPIIASDASLHFYYNNFTRFTTTDLIWTQSTFETDSSTGYFVNSLNQTQVIGQGSAGSRVYLRPGCLIKFSAGAGNHFDKNNKIVQGLSRNTGDRDFIWASINTLTDSGTGINNTGELSSGQGAVTLTERIPNRAVVAEFFAPYAANLGNVLEQSMVDLIRTYSEFGLRYDIPTGSWAIIAQQNLNKTGVFNLTTAGNNTGTGADASWQLIFETDGEIYTVRYRGLNFVFQSIVDTRFYFDSAVKVFDSRTGETLRDQIRILRANPGPDSSPAPFTDQVVFVSGTIVEPDGYEDNRRVRVTYSDSDSDGIPDDPDFFNTLVQPSVNSSEKYVFFQEETTGEYFIQFTPLESGIVETAFTTQGAISNNVRDYKPGQLFFAAAENKFYQLITTQGVVTLSEVSGYQARTGRQDLMFQHKHISPNNRRIDPAPNNIIDLYILTKAYEQDYRLWIEDITNQVATPELPLSVDLETEYADLEQYKVISDTLIYNPARFKPLFGEKADPALRATFKVVKNAASARSDSEVKAALISALNVYFDIENWDFGETFYFSELAAYLHRVLAPDVSSIVIVPDDSAQTFGSLYQINAAPDEILISAATVNDVEIIAAITASQLRISDTVFES
jgi:hypothetical protein